MHMFENNTKFIRGYDFDTTKKVKCICEAFDPDKTLPRNEHGHIACKVSDLSKRGN